jgi:hypothetical protein
MSQGVGRATRLTLPQIINYHRTVPSHSEGRFAIVVDAGRDAVDAGGFLDERSMLRTAKSCRPGAPTLVSSQWSNPLMTVARKPGHRGEHV